MDQLLNILIILIFMVIMICALLYLFREDAQNQAKVNAFDFRLDHLSMLIKSVINESINRDITELNLNESELLKREQQRNRLKRAARTCMHGDIGEKEFLKDYIRDMLQKRFGINEGTIDESISFSNIDRMSAMDQFDILLYLYTKKYNKEAFSTLCSEYGLNNPKTNARGIYFQITEEDIREVYEKLSPYLNYIDKLNILTDRIYSRFGHGCIDRLRDQLIDGVAGGYSGLPYGVYDYMDELAMDSAMIDKRYAHDSVYVILHGIGIHLKFMSFGSQEELIRVTRALVKYDAPYEMTRNRPKIVNDMKDGSRVTAVRPNYAENWAFTVRKFDTAPKALEQLLTDEGSEQLCTYIRLLVKGGAHIAVCGPQNSGKTTILKSLLYHINQTYNVRIGESVFELWMRKLLPEQNILTIRDTDSVGIKEGLELLRKTDGNCLMLGEVADIEVAALAIELAKVSEQQILTNHSMSEAELIAYFKEAEMRTGTFSDERLAEEAVAKAFQIDIQTERDVETGHRFIRCVSEIIVNDADERNYEDNMKENMKLFFERMTRRCMYRVNKLVVYKNGAYKVIGQPSQMLQDRLLSRMNKKDRMEFKAFVEAIGVEVIKIATCE